MKKQHKKNYIVIILILIFISIIIIAGSFLLYIYTQNYIKIEKIDKRAYNQKTEIISQASPIYINNLLIGAVSSEKWVSKDSIYNQGSKVKLEKIDIYDLTGKIGTYDIKEINNTGKEGNIYIKTNRLASTSEYIGIVSSGKDIVGGQTSISNSLARDEADVIRALGVYKLLNNTVKVNEVYSVTLKNGENGRIICATSDGNNKLGLYSTVVYVTDKGSRIIKYCYVKDSKKAVDWPIYSVKFVYDLNSDGSKEVIIQETNEYETKYAVMEYRQNNFYEVLSEKIKI